MAKDPSAKPTRRRRSAEVARAEVLAEARRILLEEGPQAVTLKGVAGPLGMSHVNLIHHFGSAEGLQTALMRSMAEELRSALTSRDYEMTDLASARRFIDLVFDAFGAGGAGKLTAWIALSHSRPVMEQLTEIVGEVASAVDDSSLSEDVNATAFVATVSMALADSLAGEVLTGALDLPVDGNRDIAARLMLEILGRR